MDNTIILSIIISAYNVENYIKKCLCSCINQDINKELYEIIVIDDGSKDQTPEIIDSFINTNNAYNINVIHKKNGGVSSARNFGINLSRGKYLWLVDADDYIQTNILSFLFKSLHQNDVDMLWFDYDVEYYSQKQYLHYENSGTKHKINQANTLFESKGFLTKIYNGHLCMVWQYLIKKEIILKHHISFETRFFHEDTIFTPICIYYSKNIQYLNVKPYHYIIQESSATHDNKNLKRRLLDYINISKELFNFIENKATDRIVKDWFYNNINEYIIMSFRLSIKNYDKRFYYYLYHKAISKNLIPMKYKGSKKRKLLIFFLNLSKPISYFIINNRPL